MRRLILAAIRRTSTVTVEQRVEAVNRLGFYGLARQLEGDRRKCVFKIINIGQRPFGHPDDTKAAVIRHHRVTRPDRINEFGRKRYSGNHKLAFAAVQYRREARARREGVRIGKILVDDDLRQASRLRQPANPDVKPIESGLAALGQRNKLSGSGLAKARHVEQRKLCDARVNRSDARNFRNPAGQGLRRAAHRGEDVRKLVALVIGKARLIQRPVGADGKQQRGHAAGNHQCYG